MKKIVFLICILVSTVTFAKSNQQILSVENEIPDPPNSPNPTPIPVTETVRLSAGLSGWECYTARYLSDSDTCKVGRIPSKRDIKIDIEENSSNCTSSPEGVSCDMTYSQGDWLKSLYLGGHRFIGVVTFQKFLIDTTISYQMIVEILGQNKTLARMVASFSQLDQVPNAILEVPDFYEETLKGTKVKQVALRIGPATNFDLPPPTGYGLKMPQGRMVNNSIKNQKLPKVQWKIEKGNLKVLE